MRRLALVLAILLASACARRQAPEIALDIDECRFCRMIISDARFAAAAETTTGRTVRFDSIECLAGWVLAEEQPPRAVWVTDADEPGRLIPAGEARFNRDRSTSSPMGMGWIAGSDGGTDTITWDSLLAVVRIEGALPAHAGEETH
ncbi:MAG TPA: nitrous oxide reductase accessory protein NosL [Gemmatimonadales bacterium]|nr:nitrous oxide reductase accessory protein NosL [Gemmatimonadales bacterium]